MKVRFSHFLVIVFAMAIAGCAGNKKAKYEKLSDLEGTVMGALATGITEDAYKTMLSSLIGAEVKEVVYFNRGMDALAALKAGKVDALPMHQFTADYMLKKNSDIKSIPVDAEFEGGVIMAVRVDDEALKSSLDSAINVLMQDGTIAQLESEWITNLSAENEPINTELTKIEGAPTYYVGVSGDFPPLDYMATDGRPAGFNVAIMNKIAAVLGVNFEFVSLETQARFAALSSKKIDIIFCHFQSNDSSYFDDLKTNNWIGTMPYYTYKSGCFIVMK